MKNTVCIATDEEFDNDEDDDEEEERDKEMRHGPMDQFF